MAENKKQHYVPRFYLRNFAPGRSSQIALYNLESARHIERASIKGQCYEDYFYGADGTIEKNLQLLEMEASKVIAEIVETSCLPVAETAEHVSLLTFAVFQSKRTPESGRVLQEGLTQTYRRILDSGERHRGVPADRSESLPRLADPVLESLRVACIAAPLIEDLSMKILVNKTGAEFLTSDSPVALRNQWCEKFAGFGSTGFCSKGLQIFLPLSPRSMVILFDPSVYQLVHPVAGPVILDSDVDVAALNTLQLFTAAENLYYSGDPVTRRHIDALPLKCWRPTSERVRTERLVEENGRSEIIHLYQDAPSMAIETSFLTIRRPKLRTPPSQRVNKFRTESAKRAGLQRDSLAGAGSGRIERRVFRRAEGND